MKLRLPINDIPKFARSPLGTLWIHTRGTQARLRRRTNGTTLEPTLYLLTARSNVLFKVDPDEWSPSPTTDTITAPWLLSQGFLEDGDGNQEYGRHIWSLDSTNSSPDSTPSIQLLVSVPDQSCWIETYDEAGASLALVEVPGGGRAAVQALMSAFGLRPPTQPTPPLT